LGKLHLKEGGIIRICAFDFAGESCQLTTLLVRTVAKDEMNGSDHVVSIGGWALDHLYRSN
jgi:hypothetical protein